MEARNQWSSDLNRSFLRVLDDIQGVIALSENPFVLFSEKQAHSRALPFVRELLGSTKIDIQFLGLGE